jgi:putative ABC transport system permease protein
MKQDLIYALRSLTRNPLFAVIAIATVAIGIGANTAIFSVVNGVLLRPLPYAEPERLVQVWTSTASDPKSSHSAADFLDLQRDNRSLAAVAGYRAFVFSITTDAREPITVEGSYVTVDFFDVLGVQPREGRLFTRAADATPGESLAVITTKVAQQIFGNASAPGARIRVNGEPYTIVGVVDEQSGWPEDSQAWVVSGKPVPPSPIDTQAAGADRDVRYFEAIGRLRPGVTLTQAQDDLSRVAQVIQLQHAQTSEPRDIRLGLLREQIVGDVRDALLVLQAAVGLVLLIACANVSSLLIARATGRRRELAIRAALGANRGRLIRQLLTESVVVGLIGGLLGLLLASWLVVVLLRVLPPDIPRVEAIALDRVVAAITLLTALATGMLFGVLPALQASRTDTAATIKQAGDRGASARARGRSALVVAEVALTLMLLAGAGLLINSFMRLTRVDSGFQPENVTVVGLAVQQSRYPTGASQTALYRRMIESLAQVPEVQAVGVGFPGPLRGSNASGAFYVEGHQPASPAERPFANIGTVSGGYFAALGIPVLSGRTFTDNDHAKAPDVAIVSAALARKYWPGEDAVGKRLRFDNDGDWITVVGVVGDARQLGLEAAAPPILYFPFEQFALPFTNVAVRSSAPDAVIASIMRTRLSEVDPQMPPGSMATLQTILDRSVAEPRFRSALLGAFALMALVLASVGIYGLISYSVTQRVREIGIRLALGATPRQLVTSIVREGMLLTGIGVVIGIAGALLSARALSPFLFGVGAADPVTIGIVTILLIVVSAAASYIPSRRAMRVDPVVALRAE